MVNYQIGRIEFEPTTYAAKNLASRLTTFLKDQTGNRWIVSVVATGGSKTIREERLEKTLLLEKEAMANPIVRAVFDNFPTSKFYKIDNKENEKNHLSTRSVTRIDDRVWDPLEKE